MNYITNLIITSTYSRTINSHLITHHDKLESMYKTATTIIPIMLLTAAAVATLNPVVLSSNFGLPLRPLHPSRPLASQMSPSKPPSDANTTNPPATDAETTNKHAHGWLKAFATREFSLGAGILTLKMAQEYRAMALLVAVSGGVGFVDSYAAWRHGVDGAVWMHLVPTLALVWVGPLGLWLYVF